MKIEQLKVKNFKCLRKFEMRNIPHFCVVIGANGAGKSTLFSVFNFLQEALKSNVHNALITQGGAKGFSEVMSRGVNPDESIEIEIKFRAKKSGEANNPLITYLLTIGQESGTAVVVREILQYRRGGRGRPWRFLDFANGKGVAVINESLDTLDETSLLREEQKLKDKNILAIKGLAQFEKFPAVVALGNLIERWHLSDIHISKARDEQQHGLAEHLSREGENLSLVIDYLFKRHKAALDTIIGAMRHRIPGVENVTTKVIETGQVLLEVKDRSFGKPFLVRYISDGTIKMLAYLVLLHDPDPHPLLCVEEPENQLYPTLLHELAEEFRSYANRGSQVFVSTHSPDLLNAVALNEVFWLVKKDGYTTVQPAQENEQVRHYMHEGDKMGSLWKQGLFEGVGPGG